MSIAYWCVVAAALLPYVTVAVAKRLGRYDNANPRAADTYTGLALRADSAHKNGFEAFPVFAVAVLVASGGKPHAVAPLLDILALIWVGLRLAYTMVYLGDAATPRSIIWIAGWLLSIVIFTMPAWHG